MAEVPSEEKLRDTLSRQRWQAGDTFPVFSEPTVEGMVMGTRWINETFMVVILVPPYTKKDGTKEKAAMLLRTPAACSRTKLFSYEFSFPSDEKIKEKILQANGNTTRLHEIVSLLNDQPVFLPLTPASRELPTAPCIPPELPSSSSLTQDRPTEISDHLSVQLALSQSKPIPPTLPKHLCDESVLNHLAHELSKRLTFTKPPSRNSEAYSPPPDILPPPSPSLPHLKPRRVRANSSSSRRTGSFSTSSTSRSSSDSKHCKVRSHSRHNSSGLYSCPFSSSDTRDLTRPTRKIYTKSQERKYLRYALHDLYAEYTTLKNFVDSIRSSLVASPTKPYTADLIWLQLHADYLDSLLLHMSTGPWSTWNEVLTDKLTRAFLELVVRVSPRRKYPDFFEEPVRKWMKRNRVGIASQYGPVPSFLSQAKVTDTGIEPKNGWDNWRPKEFGQQSSTTGGARNKPFTPTINEKK